MKKYGGKHGITGAIAFSLTGVAYKLFGFSSKLFGKVLFFVFVKMIPMLMKNLFKILLNIF